MTGTEGEEIKNRIKQNNVTRIFENRIRQGRHDLTSVLCVKSK